jgi:hypothetical protein
MYAYGIYQLRGRQFTYDDAGIDPRQEESKGFVDLISEGKEFNFGKDDINRFRREFMILIDRLATIFEKNRNGADEEGGEVSVVGMNSFGDTTSKSPPLPTAVKKPRWRVEETRPPKMGKKQRLTLAARKTTLPSPVPSDVLECYANHEYHEIILPTERIEDKPNPNGIEDKDVLCIICGDVIGEGSNFPFLNDPDGYLTLCPEKDLKRIVPAMKATINNNPPKSSFFQATTRIAHNTSTGIL